MAVTRHTFELIAKFIDRTKEGSRSLEKNFRNIEKAMKTQIGTGMAVTTMTGELTDAQLKAYAAISKRLTGERAIIENIKESGRQTLKTKEYIEAFTNAGVAQIRKLKRAFGDQVVITKTTGKGSRQLSSGYLVLNRTTQALTRSHERFRMELLGVLFFGMQMQDLFLGWIKNAFKATGITDLLSASLMYLAMPLVEKLIPGFTESSNKIFELDDNTRLAISALSALAGIAFFVLFAISQLGLGLYSLYTLLSGLGIISWLSGLFGGLAATISGVLEPVLSAIGGLLGWIIAIIILVGIAFLYNSQRMIDAIIMFGEGVWNVITGVIDLFFSIIKVVGAIFYGICSLISAFIALLAGDKEKAAAIIKDAIKFFLDSINDLTNAAHKVIIEGLGKIWIGLSGFIGETLIGLGKFASDILKWLDDLIFGGRNVLSGFFDWIWGWISKIIDGFKNITKSIKLPELPKGEWIPGLKLFQHGGIVTKPTLGLLGESGPEAVIPLRGGGTIAGGTFNTTINIDASISSDIDIDDLSRRIADRWIDEIKSRVI